MPISLDATRASLFLRDLLDAADLIDTLHGPVLAVPVAPTALDDLFALLGALEDNEPEPDEDNDDAEDDRDAGFWPTVVREIRL